jgi:hypothetical protein
MISYNTGLSTNYDIKKKKDQLQSFMAPRKRVKKVKGKAIPDLDRN